MTTNRKFSNKKKFKMAYQAYESLRNEKKQEKVDKPEKSEDELYDFFRSKCDDDYVVKLIDVANTEEISNSLATVSQDKNNGEELNSVLESLSKGVGYISENMTVESAAKIVESSVQLKSQVQSLGLVGMSVEQMKGNIILEHMGRVAETSLIVAAAGASFFKANSKLDFNYWLKRELVKRAMLQKEIAYLDAMEKNQTPPVNATWEDIENKIFKDEDDFDLLSRKKYCDALKENISNIFELRDRSSGKLSGDEMNYLAENEWITEDNLHLVLANLERLHINRQLIGIEQRIQERLLANVGYSRKDKRSDFFVTMDEDVTKILNNYVDMTNADSGLVKQIKQLKGGVIPARDGEKLITAIKNEEEFEAKLEKKANEKGKDLAAKMLIFASIVLSAAIIITLAVTPGAQPALIALGVLAFVALVAAHVIKPGILKLMKDEFEDNFTSFFDKIKNEFMYLIYKKEVKQAVKEKKSLNGLIQETVNDAKEKGIISEVSQQAVSVEKKSLIDLKQLLAIDFRILKEELLQAKTRYSTITFFTNTSVTEQMIKLDEIINVINETDLTKLRDVVEAFSENFNDISSKELSKDAVETIKSIRFTIKQINQDLNDIEQQHVSEKNII